MQLMILQTSLWYLRGTPWSCDWKPSKVLPTRTLWDCDTGRAHTPGALWWTTCFFSLDCFAKKSKKSYTDFWKPTGRTEWFVNWKFNRKLTSWLSLCVKFQKGIGAIIHEIPLQELTLGFFIQCNNSCILKLRWWSEIQLIVQSSENQWWA